MKQLIVLAVVCLAACDDSLPPVPDSSVDSGSDATRPDAQPDKQVDDQQTDVACSRPDGFCMTDSQCADRGLICSTSGGDCRPDPCCTGGPEDCDGICSGVCVPPHVELKAEIIDASAEHSTAGPLKVIFTIEYVNGSTAEIVGPHLSDSMLISQPHPTQVASLDIASTTGEVIVGPNTTVTVKYEGKSGGTSLDKWCDGEAKVRTSVEYQVPERPAQRIAEVWSQPFVVICH